MFDKTDYICLTVTADPERHEGLVAWLSTLEFEAFEEEEHALKAYARKEAFDEAGVNEIMKVAGVTKANYTSNLIKARNWNAEWEAAYDAVEIDDFCQIVPSFHHAKDGFTHTIHLDPKMSFGTGHHETTRLMVRQMKGMDIAGKKVLDMGCGTAVLGILALKMGAQDVLGIDIDAWSAENGLENAQRNDVSMPIKLGDVSAIPENVRYDLILANINRNVLLQDVEAYAKTLKPGGRILASGFLEKDHDLIATTFKQEGLHPGQLIQEGNWLSLYFDKAIA